MLHQLNSSSQLNDNTTAPATATTTINNTDLYKHSSNDQQSSQLSFKRPISDNSNYYKASGTNTSSTTINNGDKNGTGSSSPYSIFLAKVIKPQSNTNNSNEVNNFNQEGVDTNLNGHNEELIESEAHTNEATNITNGTKDISDGGVPLLFVEQNDVIAIEESPRQQENSDEEWYIAKSDQQIGRIPRSSCLVLDSQFPRALCHYLIDNKYFNLHVCFASFVAQDVGDLSITKGDIIVAIVPVNEHWMQGQVCFDSQANSWPKLVTGKHVGTFPLNHCWQLDTERVKTFCHHKVIEKKQPIYNNIKSSSSSSSSTAFVSCQTPDWLLPQPRVNHIVNNQKPYLPNAHSSSLSSGSSSLYSTDYNQAYNRNDIKQQYDQHDSNFQHGDHPGGTTNVPLKPPPPRPIQLPRQISEQQKSVSDRFVSKPSGMLTGKQQDKLRGWLHTVKKKTARLSTRITASLGLISLLRDEEFERHYENFKQLEKSIRVFIKNLTLFVEHFESFLLALQSTSDNLADFYRDKSHQKEINELRKKNKALTCEHFHAFKRTIDRQVISVSSQLLQKFSGPYQLVHKRTAKLYDYDMKMKEMESCRDLEKKAALREGYVIAKDVYDRINGQLIEELPLFNQFALDIFRECILVLLESRRNLILSYTKQTANLLGTPLMASYTASDVASTILMSCEMAPQLPPPPPPSTTANSAVTADCRQSCSDSRPMLNHDFRGSGATSEHGTQPPSGSSSGFDMNDDLSRPHSAMSQLSSEFDQMALAAREISSTPLSQVSGSRQEHKADGNESDCEQPIVNSVRFDEPDAACRYETVSNGSSDNKHNENIESTIEATKSNFKNLSIAPATSNNDNKSRKRRTKHQIYMASWPFVATGPNQLSITCNQPLKLIKGCDECGNSDWSLVKDKKGRLGYVPTSYIKKKE